MGVSLFNAKMTKKDKGENLKRVKEKALEQPIIVKERKGGE